ncbi:hypothetical protein PP7435_CHR1-0387 [Komagataella phaffii CBS 7435]|uniref:MARVEL domain-containing protein n=2 Tax=Komagataella phaffii TaxID=460519 RepID=C4QW22_KOMPG|nr:Hypothetical protein PAS_chr1-1_0085 [Komagataella phaffii GS115]AOA60800.1 GQ67_02654T0 [Komagataella phaffii]CAH2446111.1 hypothetical protein BQ9382_C1-2030 [Komagataella phaffii CBS 7435]AOA66869.1 GQ68_02594T0 [Komagataella phaffii GS115]CAY67445.1 Hypothetical protein PAS_chr1-1_0085 [Komagataella phaffii GS115]CCA36544.1 hypothetical protein PP7435_CHR1-0387 [Komagataella phaffii CBS 7435]
MSVLSTLSSRLSAIIIRSVTFLFVIITLGLSAASINNMSYSRGNFLVATSVFSLVHLGYVGPYLFFTDYSTQIPPFFVAIFEYILNIFWFAGWIAMADLWGDIHCSRRTSYGWGYYQFGSRCHVSKAAVAFGAFSWVMYTLSAVLVTINIVIPIVRSGSYLSQVRAPVGFLTLDQSPATVAPTVGDFESSPADKEEATGDSVASPVAPAPVAAPPAQNA